MIDYQQYSELYHHGIKGMRWGVRRYQNLDGTLTAEGKKRKSISEKASEAIDKVMSIDNKAVNRVLRTSANLRKSYSNISKSHSDREIAAASKKAKKFADQYLKEYGKKPLDYSQYNNAKKGAAVGAVLGIAVPIVLPLWATIPAGYYVGSKIKSKKR